MKVSENYNLVILVFNRLVVLGGRVFVSRVRTLLLVAMSCVPISLLKGGIRTLLSNLISCTHGVGRDGLPKGYSSV